MNPDQQDLQAVAELARRLFDHSPAGDDILSAGARLTMVERNLAILHQWQKRADLGDPATIFGPPESATPDSGIGGS